MYHLLPHLLAPFPFINYITELINDNIYCGTDPIPDAAASVKALIEADKKVLFVTNNAGSNRMQLRDKLAKRDGVGGYIIDRGTNGGGELFRYQVCQRGIGG